jgi:hypothetical protein
LLGLWAGVAKRLQPGWGAGAAAGGVDHQVSAKHLLGAAADAAEYPDPGDAAAIRGAGQADNVAAVKAG